MYNAFRSAQVRRIKFSVERSKTRRVFALWQASLLIGIRLLSLIGFAQLSMTSLSGAGRDSSGSVVPNAKIVRKHVDTAAEHASTTNEGPVVHLFEGGTVPRSALENKHRSVIAKSLAISLIT